VKILDAVAKVPAWPGRYITQPPIMKGDDVRQWQEQVNARGFKLKIDSEYGDKSEKVCRAIQKRNQLRIDGIVGPDTWRASWVGPS
jgi:peptidoglycan hydrolase-like protein with peptidoglycan-binding domain